MIRFLSENAFVLSNFRPKGGVCCYVRSTISLENIFNFSSVNFDYSIFKLNSFGKMIYLCCMKYDLRYSHFTKETFAMSKCAALWEAYRLVVAKVQQPLQLC